MTIIIAQRLNNGAIIVGDTRIEDVNKLRPNSIPGRLKIVTLGERFTVAYAGAADLADGELKRAQRLVAANEAASAEEALAKASADGRLDFIVAAHMPDFRLLRIKNGRALEIQDICAIGEEPPFAGLIAEARAAPTTVAPKRTLLWECFIDRLMINRNLGATIGGLATGVTAMPEGHRYLGYTGVYIFKFPDLDGSSVEQPMEQLETGDGHYQVSVIPIPEYGIPVLSVAILQARRGYIYSPLERPEAFEVSLASLETDWYGNEGALYDILASEVAKHVALVRRIID